MSEALVQDDKPKKASWSVRAMQGQIIYDEETLQMIILTFTKFNEALQEIIKTMFKLRDGKFIPAGLNPESQRRFKRLSKAYFWGLCQINASRTYDPLIKSMGPCRSDSSSVNVFQKLEAELQESDDPNASEELGQIALWKECFPEFQNGWYPLQEMRNNLALPNFFFREALSQAFQHLKSHIEQKKAWDSGRNAWKKEKEEFTTAHPEWSDVVAEIRKHEKEGNASDRKTLQALLLRYFQGRPYLQTPGADLSIPSTEVRSKWGKQKRRKRTPLELYVDSLLAFYQKFKEFDAPPTLTLPSPTTHPRPIVLTADRSTPFGYTQLVLPCRRGERLGNVTLRLMKQGENGIEEVLHPVRYRADRRLAALSPRTGPSKKGKTSDLGYVGWDSVLNRFVPVEIGGITLHLTDTKVETQRLPNGGYRRVITGGSPVIIISVREEAVTPQIPWNEIPDGTVLAIFRPMVEDTAWAVLGRRNGDDLEVIRSKAIRLETDENPQLRKIPRLKKRIARRQHESGKLVAGRRNAIGLWARTRNITNDRVKKAPNALLEFALNSKLESSRGGELFPRAEVLVYQNLEGFRPSRGRPSGQNVALSSYARGMLFEKLDNDATAHGLRVKKLKGGGCAELCSNCGELGKRYSERGGVIYSNRTGPFFFCTACKKSANAEENAAINLGRFAVNNKHAQAFWRLMELTREERREAQADRKKRFQLWVIERILLWVVRVVRF